jgi:hypothetical protein
MTLVRIEKSSFSTYVLFNKGLSRGVTFPKTCIYKELFGKVTHFEKKSTIFYDTISTAYTTNIIRGY